MIVRGEDRMPILQMLWRALAILVMALLVSGCATSSSHSGDAPAPTIVLQDTSPGQLALSLHLNIGGYDAATRDITQLNVGFLHQGNLVQFQADERLSCNGTNLTRTG